MSMSRAEAARISTMLPLDHYRSPLRRTSRDFIAASTTPGARRRTTLPLVDGAFRFSCLEAGKLVIALQPDRGRAHGAIRDLSRRQRAAASRLCRLLSLAASHAKDRRARFISARMARSNGCPANRSCSSEACAPEAVLGPTPLVYPFIVNDPGEAAQAKRRTSAVTIGHLTPPLVDAELFDAAREHRDAARRICDRRGARSAPRASSSPARSSTKPNAAALPRECGVTRETDIAETLTRLDAWMCDLKEMRIGDGLHVFGARRTDDPARDACAQRRARAR